MKSIHFSLTEEPLCRPHSCSKLFQHNTLPPPGEAYESPMQNKNSEKKSVQGDGEWKHLFATSCVSQESGTNPEFLDETQVHSPARGSAGGNCHAGADSPGRAAVRYPQAACNGGFRGDRIVSLCVALHGARVITENGLTAAQRASIARRARGGTGRGRP